MTGPTAEPVEPGKHRKATEAISDAGSMIFSPHAQLFKKIKGAIDALADEPKTNLLKSFSEVIAKAPEDPAFLLDYGTGCKRLADAIIAVDSLRYNSLFSQDN